MQPMASMISAALMRSGVPFISVRVKDETDRSTWEIEFAPEATAEQRAAAAAFVASFDPNSQSVKEAEQAAAAAAASSSLMIKAFFRFFIYTTQGPDVVIDQKMIDDANALLARCFKEAAQA